MTTDRLLHRPETLLTLGAVLGALCLLLGLLAVTFGVHLLVFQSGSMSPTIHTGDLALSRTVSAAELRPDDVVSVIDAGGNRVTHRVVDVVRQGDLRQLTLKGDANESIDQETYTVAEAQRVVFVLPKAGYVVSWTASPVGLVLLGGYGAFLLSVFLRGRGRDGGDPPVPPRRRSPAKRRATPTRRTTPALLAVALGGVIAFVPSQAAAAPWTDQVTIAGSTFGAHTVPAPSTFTLLGTRPGFSAFQLVTGGRGDAVQGLLQQWSSKPNVPGTDCRPSAGSSVGTRHGSRPRSTTARPHGSRDHR